MNDLQSITESQQHQNARVIVNEESTNIRWGEQNLREVSKRIQDAYGRVVFWRKNLFMLPTSAAAETTKLMNGWMKNWSLTISLLRLYISYPAFFFKTRANI